MQGQNITRIDRKLINEGDTSSRVSRKDMKAETESEIIAKHDQALQTKYHTKTNIPYRSREKILDSFSGNK
jgi:hypothetical protein